MARTKKRKVGDRIFFEYYDGTIGTAIIKKIVDDEYKESQGYGHPDKVVKYKRYYTGKYETIEDYTCLPDNDPRVKEFCKGKKFVTISLEDDLRAWLESHGAYKGDSDVADILYQLSLEYE